MGLRFRKSISLGEFLRLNLSKSGVSMGVGPRDLNVSIGPRGIRKTIGIPGTGLSYQETSSWAKTSQNAALESGTESNSGSGWIAIVVVVGIIFIAINVGSESSTTASKANTRSTPKVEVSPKPQAVSAPRPDRPLSMAEVGELQTLLRKQGFDAGASDGIVGPKTRAASQTFVRVRGLKISSDPSLSLLEAVRNSRK